MPEPQSGRIRNSLRSSPTLERTGWVNRVVAQYPNLFQRSKHSLEAWDAGTHEEKVFTRSDEDASIMGRHTWDKTCWLRGASTLERTRWVYRVVA